MTAAQCNGITIEYETYGEGDPLLLVMGLGGQLVAWPMDWVNRFVDLGFQVIRYDNRDVGLSSKMPGKPPSILRVVAAALSRRFAKSSYLLSDMADDAAGLLDHLGIDKAHVVGISMGGMISQSIAIQHPQRVLSLTSIMSNTGDRKNGKIHRSLYRPIIKTIAKTRDEAVDKGVEGFRLISGPHFDEDEAELRAILEAALARSWDNDGTARQTMAIAASPDRTPVLGAVKAPTLVIHGLVDPLVMPSGGIATAKAIPGSRLLTFPDMGHDLPKVRWSEMVDAIVDNARRGGFQGTAPLVDAVVG
jgi:pimeloyl-ACP methyl ester carboxylesterase